MGDSLSAVVEPAIPGICSRRSDDLPTATDSSMLSLMEQNRNNIGCFRVSTETRPHSSWSVKPAPCSAPAPIENVRPKLPNAHRSDRLLAQQPGQASTDLLHPVSARQSI